MSGIKPQLRHKVGEDVSSFVNMWPGRLTHSKWRTGCLGWTQHGPHRAHDNRTWRCLQQIRSYCQAARVWSYYMSWAHSIITPCTCVNNTSCNQLKVVSEPEIPAFRCKEWQRGVGTLELLAVCTYDVSSSYASWCDSIFTWSRSHQLEKMPNSFLSCRKNVHV